MMVVWPLTFLCTLFVSVTLLLPVFTIVTHQLPSIPLLSHGGPNVRTYDYPAPSTSPPVSLHTYILSMKSLRARPASGRELAFSSRTRGCGAGFSHCHHSGCAACPLCCRRCSVLLPLYASVAVSSAVTADCVRPKPKNHLRIPGERLALHKANAVADSHTQCPIFS